MMKLISVYELPEYGAPVLYDLLQEREERVNISHRELPTWEAHKRFVASFPYTVWYLIEANGIYVGSIYLSRSDEIGVFIFRDYRGRGFGKQAMDLLMRQQPRGHYLANISPKNGPSITFFKNLGFKHIQNTYELLT